MRSKSTKLSCFILVLLLLVLGGLIVMKRESLMPLFRHAISSHNTIKLPPPVFKSNVSIEEALKQRRSIRTYKNVALTLQQVSQLLWAAQGITAVPGLRTAPSAGGIYPLKIYVVSGNVGNLPAGVYRYLPDEQALEMLSKSDKRQELALAAHEQHDIKEGAIDIVITATYKQTAAKYGSNGEQYVHMEAGHVAQNIYLQCVSLGLGTVSIGSFDDNNIRHVLILPRDEDPLYIMPVGKI